MQNKFTNFAIRYFDFLSINNNHINDIPDVIDTEFSEKKSIFSKNKEPITSDISKILELELSGYATIKEQYFNLASLVRGISFNYTLIKEFADFIIDMEKVFMYNNDPSNNIYATKDEINCETKLIIDNYSFNTVYKFKDSAINMPKESDLSSFINGTHSDTSNVIFTTVTVNREAGENNVSEYKFINSDYEKAIEDELDTTLLEVVENSSKDVIIKTLYDILDNYIPKYVADLDIEISTEKLFYGKLDLWR